MERYYALNSNYEFIEYDTETVAINSKNWIVIMITDFKSLSNKSCEDFSFINSGEKQKCKDIKINNWKASLESYTGNNYGYYAKFRFVAPDGRLRQSGSHQSHTFSNVIQNIKDFVTRSHFTNWEQYDTYNENINLKFKIENLEEMIKEFKEEIILLNTKIKDLEK